MNFDTTLDYNFQKYPWFSPHLVVIATNRLAKLYGSNIENKREFKLAREMFIGAVALLGAYELHIDNKYIMQPNLQSASPDVVAVKQTEAPPSPLLLEVTQLEIVDMNDYSDVSDVVEFLKKTKLSKKKSYDNKTLIVCVINKRIQINRLKISEELEKVKPKSTIYVLGKIRGDNDKWAIFSPYPDPTKFAIYSVSETMKKYNIPTPLRLHKGTARKISYEKTHPEVTTIYDIFNLKESDLEKYRRTS
ncbi:MAG: hypothetical protein G01um10145_820 [Microgenomates group bacterium Gr01-1014_5]|nr:MAG: hypothetical protein G01um10145_820 [Microgenomates group bacterium Gr01-1014_5]